MASVTDFRRTARDVSNWGRWGDDDELGTLNFITAEKIAQAASLARHGRVFPLGVDFGRRARRAPSNTGTTPSIS